MKRRLLFALVAVAILGVAGCSDDEEKPTGVDPNTPFPHAKPTAATMQVDVEDLGEGGLALGPTGICHALTTLVVAWVNLNVEVRLLIPEAALVACLQQPSVYLGNLTWRWTANGGQGAGAWTAELTGTVIADTQIEWEMRVTGTQMNLVRFLWFDGRCNLAAQAGNWVFYDPLTPAIPKAVIECSWSFVPTVEADLTLDFENVDSSVPEFHDLLHYALADSVALISFTDASAQATTEARWDLRDGSGRAISAQGDTCCWGARPLYPDVECDVNPNTPFPYAEPAVQTMQVDVQDLESPGAARQPKGICHALTALVVTWVNLNVEVRLLIPEAALVACLQQPPVYLGNLTWKWTATGGQGAGAWTAELTGTLVTATQVEWAMRVTGTQMSLDHFLWFDGRCDLAAQAGDWIFYDPLSPATPKAVIQCTWSLPAVAEADRTLDFENVDTTVPEYHDLLHYALADSIALISFTDFSAQTTTEARWDLRDGAGRAIGAQGDTCCWGARPLFPDIECP